MCNYPMWVYISMVEGDLPWDKASIKSLEEFKSKYLIHDSCWVGMFCDLNLDRDIILGIQWDSVWLPDEIAEGTPHVEDWPYLFIRIKGMEEINTWGFDNIKNLGRSLNELEIQIVNEKRILAISDVYDGELQIIFNGEVEILALDKDKNIITI